MASSGLIPLGPWRGLNNVEAPGHAVFQPPSKPGDSLAFAYGAADVCFDSEGWPATRTSFETTTEIAETVEGEPITKEIEGAWETAGRYFVQAEGVLYEGLTTPTQVVDGLLARVAMAEHRGMIYFSDGVSHYELDGATLRNWGLPIPEIEVDDTTGDIPAGVYLVQASWVDARGNEGGVCALQSVSLPAGGGIEIDIPLDIDETLPPAAAYLNVYIGEDSQKTTSFQCRVNLAEDTFPFTVESLGTGVDDPPTTEGMQGPPSLLTDICGFRNTLLAARDNVVFVSEGFQPHLYARTAVWQFPQTVRAIRAVSDGVWVATAGGLWWVSGEDRRSYVPIEKTTAPCAKGSYMLTGKRIPKLGTEELVALFVSSDGLLAGLPGGRVAHLTYDAYTFDPEQRASFTYADYDGLRQLLIAVT